MIYNFVSLEVYTLYIETRKSERLFEKAKKADNDSDTDNDSDSDTDNDNDSDTDTDSDINS